MGKLHPGSITPKSGQYRPKGPRGGFIDREITSTKGNPLPPDPNGRKGISYVLVDSTKHQK